MVYLVEKFVTRQKKKTHRPHGMFLLITFARIMFKLKISNALVKFYA